MRVSIPGKVFLIGEYAVLEGAPAWVVAVPPRFEWEGAGEDGPRPDFHAESPAGRFLASHPEIRGIYRDPWNGQGGFGGSTAEFALAAYASGIRDVTEAWECYRSLLRPGAGDGLLPSGADLVGQWLGGAIEWDPQTKRSRDLSREIFDLPILFFSATHLPGRKTKTNAHLAALGRTDHAPRFSALRPLVERARKSLSDGNLSELGRAFTAYGDALAALRCEAETVTRERSLISRIPGVLGVKGCGALQTDAYAVVVETLADERLLDTVVGGLTRDFGLKLLACGIPRARGIYE